MSDEPAPPSTAAIDFPRIAQITRATVSKGRIVFEVQTPDEASAPIYAETLGHKLRRNFRTTEFGDYSKDSFPTSIAIDEHDKTKVVVTYARTLPVNMHFGDPTDPLVEAFEEANETLTRQHEGKMGIHANKAVGDAIEAAVDALRELNGNESTRVARPGGRDTGNGPGGRSL